MKHNYHTHTYRCGHACGTEEEYIKKAIAEGLETLGFSDHSPYPCPDGFVSYCRMPMSATDDYVKTLLGLREKYRGYIDIRIGFETEYYPRYFDRLIEWYRRYPIDYIIYAGHYIGNEGCEDCFCGFDETSDPCRLSAYVDSTIAAMRTGRFTFIAHPDMIHFVGDRDLYREEAARLIGEAKRLRIPLEINLNGIRDSRYYPNPDFWQIAGWLGADAVLGCDAHHPRHIADGGEIEAAYRFADKYKINVKDKLELVNPIF